MIRLLYLDSRPPSRSEIFVYRQLLAPRELGWQMLLVYLRRPFISTITDRCRNWLEKLG